MSTPHRTVVYCLSAITTGFNNQQLCFLLFKFDLILMEYRMPAKEEKKRPTSKAEKNKPKTKEELKAKKAANAAKVLYVVRGVSQYAPRKFIRSPL